MYLPEGVKVHEKDVRMTGERKEDALYTRRGREEKSECHCTTRHDNDRCLLLCQGRDERKQGEREKQSKSSRERQAVTHTRT